MKTFNNSEVDSLQTLAELISEVMGSPVTIEDEAHRLLAYSMHDPNTDPARIATIIGRRVPEHVQRALYESGAMQKLQDSPEPQHIEQLSEVGLSRRMAISVWHYDEIVGYIWLLEYEGSYTEQQLELFRQGARIAAGQIMQQQRRQQHIDLLRRLLSGRFQSEQEAAQQAKESGIELFTHHYVLLLEHDHQPEMNGWVERMIQAASEYAIRVPLHMQEPSRLVLLCGFESAALSAHYTDPSALIRAMIARASELLPDQEELYLVAGEQVGSALHIQRSYRQARELILLHRQLPETRSVHYYPEAGFYRYLPAMHREAEQFPVIWGPIDRLAAYDQEHNSNLLQTLAVFLDLDSDTKRAATKLHVHSNTLNYRLKRISEVGGIDLTSMSEKVTLYLELKLLWFDTSN